MEHKIHKNLNLPSVICITVTCTCIALWELCINYKYMYCTTGNNLTGVAVQFATQDQQNATQV